ncbi:MAG TPA: ATP-dependent 6-phosphofructokinase, partial [Gemmatimonadaceae bacterium]|nr:ATP-dependent 6-phosphofructokinase [Gemmatimonadaceae bacterium]
MTSEERPRQKIGILTGGGDAPGLNSLIEATCRGLLERGHDVIGICDGFEGIFGNRTRKLTLDDISGLHVQAGTVLGASQRSPLHGREAEFIRNFRAMRLDGLVVAGGDGTFHGLAPCESEIPIIGVPKTIDNDVSGTEIAFGYDTACAVVAESADALRATASAHHRVFVVETMGRTTGWIALGGGLAAYADVILLPERPFQRRALLGFVRGRQERHQRSLIVVASEGTAAAGEEPHVAPATVARSDAPHFDGCGQSLARWIEAETGWESRHVVLGHLQRARQPTTNDRFLTLAMGVEVTRMVEENAWGRAVVYRDGRVLRAPIVDLMQPTKRVSADHRWVRLAQS